MRAGRAALVLVALMTIYLGWRLTRSTSVTYSAIEDHFKYGSTGGEIEAGIPYVIWKALPEVFREHLADERYDPQRGYQAFGFIYEDGKDLPIGVSKRNVQGLDRVFLNCAVCHAGTVRETATSTPRVYLGMPANTVDLESFQEFLFKCAEDGRFTGLLRAWIEHENGAGLDLINRAIVKHYAVYVMKDRLLSLRDMFCFTAREPRFGPGRFDTFNPPKALLRFPMHRVPQREWVGTVDFPSIWNQRQRKDANMQLHWDGNNSSVEERNRSAAFGTGAFPPTLDRPSVRRIEAWLLDLKQVPYPFPRDSAVAAKGKSRYLQHCSKCHGQDGRDFSGELVGKVTPIEKIQTDRSRLDSYSEELCAVQNTLYAGYEEERFKHFRKTHGYANLPLDGIWLRAPYLHNGSVPNLRALLEPAADRPATFYRGYDVYDQENVGFVCEIKSEGGRDHFLFDTKLPGNSKSGHEYGTELSPEEKSAIVEFMKGF